MTVTHFSTTLPAPPSDPYAIAYNPDSKLFDLTYNGLFVDDAPDYGSADTLRMLHAALKDAELHPETFASWLLAGGAAFAREADGGFYRPFYCGRCQGWHIQEGR